MPLGYRTGTEGLWDQAAAASGCKSCAFSSQLLMRKFEINALVLPWCYNALQSSQSSTSKKLKTDSSEILFKRRMKNLNTQIWARSISFAIALGLLLFIPAGTIRYWQAWIYLIVFFASSATITIYLMKNDPALLARRMRAGPRAEQETAQKIIMLFAMISFIGVFAASASDYRLKWSPAPIAMIILGDIAVVIGFFITFMVVKENTFASATIEVSENQTVVSSGLYSIVRHPMYSGGLLILLGTPLALGSLWGLALVALSVIWLIWRLIDEEKFLSKNLPGYDEYQQKVQYRLVPYFW
jgi:protein-S-isoprenylcysteine O-methyltransferase Ste14